MSRWSLIRLDARTLGRHAPAWDALNERAFCGHPLLRSAFVDALLHHWGDGSEYLCALDGDAGTHAMCLLQEQGLGRWKTFCPSQAPLGPQMITHASQLPSLLRSLPGYVAALDLLSADPLLADLANSCRPPADIALHGNTMHIALEGSFEAYWATRPRGLRQNIERYERRVSDDGSAARHVCVTQPAEMEKAVTRYAELEARGWKAGTHSALLPGDRQSQFYSRVLEQSATVATASVHELWLGDRLAASRLLVGSGQMLVSLKTAHDESLRRYAPGRLLLRRVIEASFARHAGCRLEFYTRATADQLSWATGHRALQHWTVYRSAASCAALNLARALRAPWLPIPRPEASDRRRSSVEVHRHPDDLPADAARLMLRAEHESVQHGPAWYRNLVDNVFAEEGGDGVSFFVLRIEGRVAAVMPVHFRRHNGSWQAHSLGNFYTALYAPALLPNVAGADLVPLIRAVREHHTRCAMLQFAPMDPNAAQHGALWLALRAAGLVPLRYYCFGNWYLQCLGLDWSAYLASRDSRLRNTLKRMTRKFEADGGRLEIISQAERWPQAYAAFQAVYAASWKIAEPYPRFVPGLVETCARNGWLRMGIAWLGERPIAAQLWIVARGRADIYKVAYDEAAKQYSPGSLLTAHLMRHAIEQEGVGEVDYLIGDDAYKQSWMTHRRERWGIVAYSPQTIGGWLGLGHDLAGRVGRPLLDGLARRLARPK